MFKRILIAIDDGKPAARAVEVGIDFARQVQGEIAILHVVDTAAALTPELGVVDEHRLLDLRRRGESLLSASLSRVPSTLRVTRQLREGDPGETIITTAREWDADLIALGSDSRGRLAHFLLGSTADAVIRRAPCPVITVRQDITRTREQARPVAITNQRATV
jgi:nucleotide-binding universal stress UspA family protein